MSRKNKIEVKSAEHPTLINKQINYVGITPRGLLLQPLPVDAGSESTQADLATSILRFRYTARQTSLLGREHEWEQLRVFLDRPEPFLWWLAVGPGGVGKSRLALDVVLARRAMGWEAGFLGRDQTWVENGRFLRSPPTHWPSKPVILIADYILGKPEEVGELVQQLTGRVSGQGKVRLLLLEREGEEADWFKPLLGQGFRMDCIVRSRHRQESLRLGPLSLEHMIAVIRQWPGGKRIADAHLRTILERMDVGGRPLYAIFLADALQKGEKEALSWNKDELIRHILDREKERWRESSVLEERDLPLLYLATLCGGIDTDREDLPETVMVRLDSANQVHTPPWGERVLHVTGTALTLDQPRLSPLEPDLLGELFILEGLCPTHASPRLDNTRALRIEILQDSWQINPVKVYETLSRCAQDYPGHAALWSLMVLPPMQNQLTRFFWAQTVVNITAFAGIEIRNAQNLLNQLAELAMAYPDDAPLREAQAMGYSNLIASYSKTEEIQLAKRTYDNLVALATAYPDDATVREWHAKGMYKLSIVYCEEGKLIQARELYEALVFLAATYPEEPQIRAEQAKGAYNLSTYYGNVADLTQAQIMYETLHELATVHTSEAILRELQAQGAVNLSIVYGNTGKLSQALNLYEDIVALVMAHPCEAPLRELQAQGAVNLIIAYGNAGELTQALGLYEAISALAIAHSVEEALRDWQAKGAYNLCTLYGNARELAQAQRLYEDIAALTIVHPDEASLRESQAKGAVNLIVAYRDAGDLPKAQEFYEKVAEFLKSELSVE
ncbi:hypothetical protein SIID45300_02281 [Candidatus Magnetaquicoccaceae bacterium FCR-1]|uniref:Tetratricopeptide repeat protein n=1 Tax=Candidatus Magnetaquiglobus chichijimensis TaxID=3141448 RepID=A0ABQ0CAM6_9PROT